MDLLYELDDEGLLGQPEPRPDGLTEEQNNLRLLADRHQRIAKALVYGSKAFSSALPTALLMLAKTGLIGKTTMAMAHEGDVPTWPDQVELFFDLIHIEESGMTDRSIRRLKRFLAKTLPALQEAGAEIGDEQVLAIVKEGDFHLTRSMDTVSVVTEKLANEGQLTPEAATSLATHIAENTPSHEIIGEFFPEERDKERMVGLIIIERDSTITLALRNLSERQSELVQAALADLVDFRFHT